MRHARGFTLAELMVVIGIMLILMVATFGVLGVLAEQAGPDSAVASIQAMLNGARDYAASNGVTTQVYFYADPNNLTDGATMTLQYLAPGKIWADVPGRKPVPLHDWMAVCRKMPDTLPNAPTTTLDDVRNGTTGQTTDQVVDLWKQYRVSLLAAVQGFAMDNGPPPKLKALDSQNKGFTQFGVVFDPSGYLAMHQNPAGLSNQADDPIYALTVVQVAGGMKVTNYAFFLMNATSGNRILFE